MSGVRALERLRPALAKRSLGYLESDMVGVDEVVLGANDARLRVADFADVCVQNLNIETSDEVSADALLCGVRSRLADNPDTQPLH